VSALVPAVDDLSVADCVTNFRECLDMAGRIIVKNNEIGIHTEAHRVESSQRLAQAFLKLYAVGSAHS